MLRRVVAALSVAVLLVLGAFVAFAAISLSTSTAETQNFDGMGTAATATLPADFRVDATTTAVRTVGTFASAGTATARVGGANLATNAANGIYNFGAGTTASGGADRAVGFLSSGTATGSGNLYAQFANTTGASLTGLQISYNVEKYRGGTNAAGFRIQLFYSSDGNTWTSAGNSFLTAFAADATNNGFATAPGATVAISNQPLTVAVPNGGNVYLAWNYSVASGTTTTNAQALAIDDISVTANGAPPADDAPSVTSTTPTNNATNVAVNSNVVINFSESVTATASAFSIQCPTGTPVTFTQSGSPATSFTLTPNSPLPYSTTCAVTVAAAQISDTDTNDPPDNMTSDYSFAFTTAPSPVDTAPTVLNTTPVNGATSAGVNSAIVINFSESVTATASAFSVQCPLGSPQTITPSASPASSFTLTPTSALPNETVCTVTVTATEITDTDGSPDHLAADYSFAFTTAPVVATNIIINEVDSDTPGNDAAEFVELYDGGVGNTPLDGLVLVFYNGNGDTSYAAFDLDGYHTNANGYFVIGNPGVPHVDLTFDPGTTGFLQNGADAVALYVGNASDFPNGTAVTTTNLQDAIVYDTDDPDEPGLLVLLNPGEPQVNENALGNGTAQSMQRCFNGTGGARNTSTYLPDTPTPGVANTCTPPPPPTNSPIVVSQLYGGGGNSGATYRNDFVELYNRSALPVDVSGWSLQYAAATGNGWDFLKQPLGGTIGPGEFFLIALASGGANGADLPAANITGQINMAGASGKIALVDNFDGLVGNCPLGNPHVMDLVGYGAADCHEGSATAPTPSATNSIFRLGGGATDTNDNAADFVTGLVTPRRTAPIIELGPMVLSSDPRANGVNAPRDATIEITFTEPVNVVGSWFDINCVLSGPHNSATTSAASGQDFFITPNVNFIAGELCTVTIFKDQIHDQDLDDSGPNTDTLAANYVWSFTVATGTAAPDSDHLLMGNPSGAVADINQPNNYLMQKDEYVLSYNKDLGRPNWVSWHLTDEWIGTLTRVDSFRADPAVPADWYRVQSFDFAGSGFDRGHMTPNADRDKETSIPINQATFLMSNMVAQAPDNNQGPWALFEGYLRTLLPANELYIVAGGSGAGGTGSGGFATTLAGGHVSVPAYTWKVALVLPKGAADISRVSCSTRTIAVILPNTQGIRNDPWENYLTSVDAVEALTGYDLFSNLPPAIQACVEAGINGNNPSLDSTAPTVVCDPPDGAWHAADVSLHCTASDTGSGLANPADASFSLFTSVADGTENANASTGSRTVCDVAANCTTIGPIAGNKIDRKAPSVSCTAPDGLWHGDNVAIACTASDGGAELANAGDASFSLMTSVGAGVEDGNASTGSRNVCDALNNCTTAGPIAGNKIDRKAPSVSCAAPDGLWHGDNVALACTASDGGAGLANGGDAVFALMTSVGPNTEDANASTGSRSVCDPVGNCTPAGPIAGNKIDRKAPSLSCATPDGLWHGDNVALACTASDGGAGLANAGDASFSLMTAVGANVEDANASTGSRNVCDALNNCTTAGPIAGNKIDRKAPSITLAAPLDGASFGLGQIVNASYNCADGGSGSNTCSGTVASGAVIDTGSLGPKTFTVTTTDYAGNSAHVSVNYTVALPTVASAVLSPTTVTGGATNSALVVTFNAPAFGTQAQRKVTFASDNAAATIRAQITPAAGETSVTVNVMSDIVATATVAHITATMNGGMASADLTIVPLPMMTDISVAPGTVVGGAENAVGTITVNGPAVGGATLRRVTLTSDNPAVTVPAAITIPIGATTATFNLTSQVVSAATTAHISATLNGVTDNTAALNVTPLPAVTTAVLNPTSVVGGASTSTLTVTLGSPAVGTNAQRRVTLTSSNLAVATVPATVVVPLGATSVDVVVTSKVVAADAASDITASLNGGTALATLSVTPLQVVNVSVNPPSVTGGAANATLTIDLNGPAAGTVAQRKITLSSDTPGAASVPLTVTAPVGATSVTVTITSHAVASDKTVTLSATINGVTKTTSMTVLH